MTPPAVAALRLLGDARAAPRPPLGVTAWAVDAPAMAVLLEAGRVDVSDPGSVAAQIPRAAELPPATLVFVLGGAARGGALSRWLRFAPVKVPRVARCTALVARGYVSVGAGVDAATGADLAWGLSSPY